VGKGDRLHRHCPTTIQDTLAAQDVGKPGGRHLVCVGDDKAVSCIVARHFYPQVRVPCQAAMMCVRRTMDVRWSIAEG